MNPAVVVENISRSFNGIKALDDISLEIESSKITGIIGPDGAGKSTFFRILISLEKADSGKVIVLGTEVPLYAKRLKGLVGYMPGRFSLYPDLTVKENLNFYARIHNTTIADKYHLIKPIYSQLEPFKNRLAAKLSGGMKQKLALCCALIHQPQLLILDEPTTGVDVVSRKEFWEILRSILNTGLTILVSTPYMDEANQCDRIILLHKGKPLSYSTPKELINNYSSDLFRLTGYNLFEMKQVLEKYPVYTDISVFGKELHLTMSKSDNPVELISGHLGTSGFDHFYVEKISPGIEDCFLELVSMKS